MPVVLPLREHLQWPPVGGRVGRRLNDEDMATVQYRLLLTQRHVYSVRF